MSITKETALAHAGDKAVTCCRFEAGSVIEASILEDPAIFPDLLETGLLEFPTDALSIGEVLGGKLKATLDALTPLTPAVVELPAVSALTSQAPVPVQPAASVAPQVEGSAQGTQYIHIHIGEGRDIDLKIPVGMGLSQGMAAPAAPSEPEYSEQVLRSLKRSYIRIEEIRRGPETKIQGTTLFIREGIEHDAVASQELVTDLKLEIITPADYCKYSETIMDVQPVAVKVEGELGVGVTRVIDGAVLVVTGTDENGVQIGEFGSSEGPMDRNIMWGRPGSPDHGDLFIKTQVTIKAGTNMERPGPLAAHKASDFITEEIRSALKEAQDCVMVRDEDFRQVRRRGRKKLLIVKEIMGQGAMHDNLILPLEPVGTFGAKANVDLGNLPVMLSPLEVLDGGIHALTCIGPASKETSRHYFREPLVLEAMADPEIDLCGVLFVGSPQINSEKFYVSRRLGMTVEAIDPDGVIITTEGFGNNHIDFAAHHEEVGRRGYPVVGMTFSAVQGALVVGNDYMKHMVDNNKSKQGIENEILENNCLAPEDAVRAIAMIKAVMAGEPVKEAERKWTSQVKLNNIKVIEEATGRTIRLEDNEQVLEKSRKRAEIYEKEE
ncbi:D-proline reductase (dithiol) proprotein PrdA [Proteiniclasticum sp. QWL-01]|uniref:D-proline reductase (dithiol) proprotein PrdA n=1 Tax=Proteiniclasticum sp. QWL-01 TaxID=3036945 RepID=UPI00240FCA78|nr:D-proline reductase (dithiol) proprotein PrdA [Proteiniclasticum sp. QWL-01]WFF72856.1 D-proline reductase (dithiol) proprotein PrdA [Proteiniclasticum sp. QWL-01]